MKFSANFFRKCTKSKQAHVVLTRNGQSGISENICWFSHKFLPRVEVLYKIKLHLWCVMGGGEYSKFSLDRGVPLLEPQTLPIFKGHFGILAKKGTHMDFS